MCFTQAGKSLCTWQGLYCVLYDSYVPQNKFSPEKIDVSEMAVVVQAGFVGVGHKGCLSTYVKDRCGLSKWDDTGLNYCYVTALDMNMQMPF